MKNPLFSRLSENFIENLRRAVIAHEIADEFHRIAEHIEINTTDTAEAG